VTAKTVNPVPGHDVERPFNRRHSAHCAILGKSEPTLTLQLEAGILTAIGR
jgi:hypothetical protein